MIWGTPNTNVTRPVTGCPFSSCTVARTVKRPSQGPVVGLTTTVVTVAMVPTVVVGRVVGGPHRTPRMWASSVRNHAGTGDVARHSGFGRVMGGGCWPTGGGAAVARTPSVSVAPTSTATTAHDTANLRRFRSMVPPPQ